jgi:uncharacterized RDD family membrane protein YckC
MAVENQEGPGAAGYSRQQANPYAPPIAATDAAAFGASVSTVELVDASTGQRFANMLIDVVGYMALAFVVGVVFALLDLSEVLDGIPDQLFGLLILSAYYIGFEAILGRTPGKFVTGTRVVHEKGGRASFSQIIGRTVVRFVPFESFTFLSRDGGGRWHDRWSKTRVVRTRGL